MTGWFLTWILVIRVGLDFTITPNERQMPSFDACTRAKISLEKELVANPVSWGDFTSFSINCVHKDGDTP